MSNEELVKKIQAGEGDKLPELWNQVERFVWQQARRRYLLSGGLGGVEPEDLYQSGYIALVAAVDSFDPEAGRSFISWLTLALKTAFAEAGGYQRRRQASDPIHRAGSLDVPIGKDGDDGTLADLQADPTAAQDFQDAEERIYLEQLRKVLDTVMAKLPDNQAETLRRHYYAGQTLNQIADVAGASKETVRQREKKALRALRRKKELQQFVEQRTPYYLRVGVSAFLRTGESSVERIVFKREKLEALWDGGHKEEEG